MAQSLEQSDVTIINTCGFIDSAIQESLETIQESLEKSKKVMVTGCLGAKKNLIEKHFGDNSKLIHISGPQEFDAVMQNLQQAEPLEHSHQIQAPVHGFKVTPPHYAYVKIAEGCNQNCSFCIIPSMRGKMRSRSLVDILSECQSLVDSGCKEILLVAQDTAAYGLDRGYEEVEWQGNKLKTNIQSLVKELDKFGVWIRLHYIYPYKHIDSLVESMHHQRLLPYLDIPFQHANPRILKLMRRPGNFDHTLERIAKWREIRPDIAIRSTFIVGFPSETDAEFQELLDFLKQAKMQRVGCFAYSPVAGAKANQIFPQVSEQEQQNRYTEFMKVQKSISKKCLKNMLGKTISVLIDAYDNNTNTVIGRSYMDAPEIDGNVFVETTQEQKKPVIGSMIETKITNAQEYDLVGSLL